jgi:hypothetical protein
VYIDGVFVDTINYKNLSNIESQALFDKNLRTKLGAAEDEWIDIDNYDPKTFSLDMFSAEELLNEGNSYVSYSGYYYLGTKTTNKPLTMKDMKNGINDDKSQILSVLELPNPSTWLHIFKIDFQLKIYCLT